MIDTHCHLAWPEYDTDRDVVLARARAAGITAVVVIGAGQGIEGNRRALALAEMEPDLFAAVGLHPHDADQFGPDAAAALAEMVRHPKVVAIGEIGLDYHYDNSDRGRQQEAFRAQLALAASCRLPMLIHHRDAQEDLLSLLGAHPPAGILHCFGGPLDFAHRLIGLGFALGIGGIVTFKNAAALREVVAAIPLAHLVLETDAPFLAPVPYRGKRNEPAYVAEVATAIAQIKGVAVEDAARITSATARRILHLPT